MGDLDDGGWCAIQIDDRSGEESRWDAVPIEMGNKKGLSTSIEPAVNLD